MFCYQCEQTERSSAGNGCAAVKGNCGKDEETSDLQDLLIHLVKGIAQYGRRARALGAADNEAASFESFAMFTTLTNVNFTADRFVTMIAEAASIRDRVKAAYEAAARAQGKTPEILTGPSAFVPAADKDALLKQAAEASLLSDADQVGQDIIGLRALVLYGLKGACAYAHHAEVLGYASDEIYAGVEELLDFLASNPTDADILLGNSLKVGELNLKVLELLDAANTGRFGAQTPTAVRTTPVQGKAILVSGHDLGDIEAILKQTAGTGINVYTHGEMLPAHAYPVLKAYPHLAGHYGTAWQNQRLDFDKFPGPIVMTSNCIIEPKPSYKDRVFTTGPVGWPGVSHIANGDYAPVLEAARAMTGFTETAPQKTLTVGFGHDAVLGVADQVIDAVKTGAIKHFFLIGGCDGARPGRNYYSEFATSTPGDTVMLTLGCAKFRFNHNDYGAIGGIPRLLDVGQCNDSYSAIKIATALAGAFECGVNDLPLSLIISWFEQKAAAVLLTLLALGVRNIHLGPTLPAFLTPNLVQALVDKFGLRPIGNAKADMTACLNRTAA